MFQSFFPKPKAFFFSSALLAIFSMIAWYYWRTDFAMIIGLPFPAADTPAIIGIGFFVTNNFLVFYLYFLAIIACWAGFWFFYAPHKWQYWSVLGSALIIFNTFISVQTSVALNHWSRQFFDNIQTALGGEDAIAPITFYLGTFQFFEIVTFNIILAVLNIFFVSHYVFRWRTAMNDYYTARWSSIKHIEGASQRIQEDTMRFAAIMKTLGVSIIDAVMTLFAFLPLLYTLSAHITALPFIGKIPAPLFSAAIFWAIFGTVLLLVVGIKLPGLEFKNQRVEAAFRKELVYGEDDKERADPMTLKELFGDVRKNYFRLYFHNLYFNVARYFYLQTDNIVAIFLLIPTIAAGTISYGIMQQILRAFGQVSESFQYLVKSWPTIIDLLSVRKRLVAFEVAIDAQERLPSDQEKPGGE